MAERIYTDFKPKWMTGERDPILEDFAGNCNPDPPGEESLGRFGHHPDQEIDSNVEVERLLGLLCEAHAGLLRALDYRAATPEALAIKHDVRDTLRRTGYTLPLGKRADF